MSEANLSEKIFTVWDFPSLDEFCETTPSFELDINAPDNADLAITGLINEIDSNSNLNNDHQLSEQIKYLDNLGFEIKRMLAEVDANLIKNMVAIIRATVKKIILKELALDENLFGEMIKNSLENINKDNESCVLTISEEDRSLFEKSTPLNYIHINIDSSLHRGDFIIKTKVSEIQAILEQRLTALFGI